MWERMRQGCGVAPLLPCVWKAQLEAQSQQVSGISQSTAPCDLMVQRVCRWRASVPSHPLQTRASFLLCTHTHISVSFQRTFREIMLLQVSGQGRLPASPGVVSPNKGKSGPLTPRAQPPPSPQEFGDHPNIVHLLDVIRAENDRDIYLLFESMGE